MTDQPRYPQEGTQEDRVLQALLAAEGAYVYADHFVHAMYLTQSHRAIWNLEHRFGWTIERSLERNPHGFMGYAIKAKAEQLAFI